jgi:Tfp pilus assembly protein PilE
MSPTTSQQTNPSSTRWLRRQRRHGLSVVEATMSVFVAGVALMLAVQSYSIAARWQRQLEIRELASLEAANVMERVFQQLQSERLANAPSPTLGPNDDPAGKNRRESPASPALTAALPGVSVTTEITPGEASLKEQRVQVTVTAPGNAGSQELWAQLTAWHYPSEVKP